jgi:predicted amidohydrolase YtcJ
MIRLPARAGPPAASRASRSPRKFAAGLVLLFLTLAPLEAAMHSRRSQSPSSGQPAAARPQLGGRAPADLVLLHADVYTVDPRRPRARAVAVRGDRIEAVGPDEQIEALIGPGTRVVDLHGRFVMPGFNDAHVHLESAGLAKLRLDFTGARSLAEFRERIRKRLADFQPGEWILGRGWDHTLWPEKRFPTREDLDAISRDHPIFLTRVDGHVAVANSLALKLAGISKHTPDPPGGRIVRDARTGEPNGMLEEDAAMSLVLRAIPPVSPALRRRALALALADATRSGVTSVQDFSSWDAFLVYQQLAREGRLTVRVTEWLPFDLPLPALEEMRREGGGSGPWVRTGALKAFLDGSLGSRTAALLAPYSDDPSTSGILREDPAKLIPMTVERDRAGFQINFHAIGDRAVRLGLDAFAAAEKANPPRDRRDRIEHAQVVAPGDAARFARLGVIASMQPCHLLDDARWAAARLGAERARGAYAWKTMLDHGVHLAIGTDEPVEPIDPVGNLYACVARRTADGFPPGGFEPQEEIPMDACLRAYTLGSAYAEFSDDRLGQLVPGKLADLVALSADPARVAPGELWNLRAMLTIVGGRIVYEEESPAPAR